MVGQHGPCGRIAIQSLVVQDINVETEYAIIRLQGGEERTAQEPLYRKINVQYYVQVKMKVTSVEGTIPALVINTQSDIQLYFILFFHLSDGIFNPKTAITGKLLT